MKLFTKSLLSFVILLAVTEILQAQDTTKAKAPGKDPQNQLQFLKPDMESEEYNFYNRKKISTPLMMSYDLDSAVYQKGSKKEKQQKSYLERQYAFPARPRDAWELGINFGAAVMSGDVKPYYRKMGILQNIGAGFTIRKAIGYSFSFRGGYNFMMMTGRNWEADQNFKYNQALRGGYDPRVNYYNNPTLSAANTQAGHNMNTLYFHNYRMMMHELHIEGIVNLGNINFHRERSIVSFYVLGGVSVFLYNTKMDALDNNGNVHDFSKAWDVYVTNSPPPGTTQRTSLKTQVLDQLENIFDGKYESQAEFQNNVFGFKNWQFIPTFTVGAGLQFHVSKWVTLGIEQRFIVTQEDLLDGYRWTQDEYASFTPNSDNISYSSITLGFHLGLKKRTEPLYWLNPVHYSYKKIGEIDPEAIANELFKDDDNDGVPNRLDKEPNTKPDCPVDAHGVALDSDNDGIIDCEDKQPYTPAEFLDRIDSNGVAPNCCDLLESYGAGALSSPNGYIDDNGNIVGHDGTIYPPGTDSIIGKDGVKVPVTSLPKGKQPTRRVGVGGYDCSKIELPDLIFDHEKYYLDPQYFGNLHQIAERLQMCPDMKLVVTGNDESRNDPKFNEQLAWNRANAAVDYLSEKYGISRDRFILKYKGGKKAATGSEYQKKMTNKVQFRYANDGENGDSNPPAPHPGLKAGSNK